MSHDGVFFFYVIDCEFVYILTGLCYNFGMKSIVAFDIGDKRIGVAFSDPFGEYAIPSDTYFRTGNLSEDIKALLSLAEGRGVECIVCGLPLNADGTESVQTQKTRRFIEALKNQTALPVEVEDERYTTREARRDLIEIGVSTKKDKRKKAVDSIAAAYILEAYLSKAKRRNDMKEERDEYDEENNIVELIDDEGKSLRYEHLMTFTYKGEWYCAFTPAEEAEEETDEEEGDEVVIYHLVGGENDETLEPIEDDALLDEVFAEFCNQYEDFEDADEAASLEPDGEDED